MSESSTPDAVTVVISADMKRQLEAVGCDTSGLPELVSVPINDTQKLEFAAKSAVPKELFLHDIIEAKFRSDYAESLLSKRQESSRELTLSSVRAYYAATPNLGIKPKEIAKLGSLVSSAEGRDLYPVFITSMQACARMCDNYQSLVELGYNNILAIATDRTMGLVYVC